MFNMFNLFKKISALFLIVVLFQIPVFAVLDCELPEKKEMKNHVINASQVLPEDWESYTPHEKGNFSEELVDGLFGRAGFFSCPSKHPVGNQGADGLYVLMTPAKNHIAQIEGEPIIILNEVKYSSDGQLRLGQMGCKRCVGGPEECNQLSWKWCYNAIEWIETKSPAYCGKDKETCKVVCPAIQEKLLRSEKALTTHLVRMATLVDSTGNITFFSIGNEYERGVSQKWIKLIFNKIFPTRKT